MRSTSVLIPIGGYVYWRIGRRTSPKRVNHGKKHVIVRFSLQVVHKEGFEVILRWYSSRKFPDLISLNLNDVSLDIREVNHYLTEQRKLFQAMGMDMMLREFGVRIAYRMVEIEGEMKPKYITSLPNQVFLPEFLEKMLYLI